MSDHRSFGSNYHPSSQSRKISIGVMADTQPKRNPGTDKADGDVIARVEKLKSATATDLQANKKDKGDLAARQRSSAQVTGRVTSPWTRSSHRKLGTLENVLSKQTSSLSGSKGLNKGLDVVHQAPARESFQDFPISTPQHTHGELNGGKNDKVTDRSPGRMEEPPSAVLQQKVASQREEMGKPGKEQNGTTDALRSKLWEILGKASPANNEDVNSETPEVVKTNLKLSQDKGSNDDPLIKPRHNSDSIETDSESPEVATRRPLTRSLLQKRVGAKGVQKRTKAGANIGRKTAEEVNNIFSFDEGLRGKAGTAAMNSAVMPKKQRGRRKNTVVQCRKAHSRKKDEADGILKEASKSNTPPRSESLGTGKRSSFKDKKGSSREPHPQSKAPKHKPDIRAWEKDFHPSPEAETAATPEIFQGLSKNGEKQERPSGVFMENPIEPENEFQSPTFGYKAPISSPSPCFSPEASPLQPRNISPTLDETETPIFSFGTKKTSQGTTGQASDTEKRLPDFFEKKRDYSFRREISGEQNEDLVLSDPSSDERDSDGSGEDSPVLGHYNSPEERETANWSNEKSKLGSSSAKRNSNFKGTGCVVLSPPTSLSQGIQETDSFQDCSEMDEDDGLGRAVALFAMALQNYEKKVKSAAEKKSSEIIASVSEEIHLELENVKSHIITEAGKASNLAKTKRKHAETRLEEQQEKMRMIHEKFKDDVSHQLEEFKSSIDGLEAHHSDLKGSIKKQRTSHQKLIANFEGGIETKLDNASKRIESVNKSARGKMMQLKMIVAECLKDDVFG
ncbi:PREDICTED: uncharacterized protein LOC104793679 [Camelina sativa]|uniref:Uncharacterized protein LOC104793679 n=1 Tax=Camelina sativa TaxID=90675 RepID=A0ABM1Q6P9_CAMSA|nr:PREDICTED: uncharacterized protein LOC104793679 [Camelina sativa]